MREQATRCGRLMHDYGPAVVDVYGSAKGVYGSAQSVLANFSRYAAAGGTAPGMYLPHPPQARQATAARLVRRRDYTGLRALPSNIARIGDPPIAKGFTLPPFL